MNRRARVACVLLVALTAPVGFAHPADASGPLESGGTPSALEPASALPPPTFTPNARLNTLDGEDAETTIATDGRGNVYAGWIRIFNGGMDLACAFARSPDTGDTWAEPEYYVIQSGGGGDPVVVADRDGSLHRFCMDGNEYVMSKSTDGGATWGAWSRFRAADRPWFIVDGQSILMVEAWGQYNAQFRVSHDAGATWSSPSKISGQAFPRIARDAQDVLYVATGGENAFTGKVNFNKSADGGATWSNGIRISNDGITPEIAVDPAGKHVYIAWERQAPPNNYYVASVIHSEDGGLNWDKQFDLNSPKTMDVESIPSILVDCSGVAHVAWMDDADGDGIADAWYSNSTDHGKTWAKAVRVSDPPTGKYGGMGFLGHYTALVQLPSGELGYVWSDDRNRDTDVWFSKAPVTNCGAIARIEVNPSQATITADQTQMFAAQAYDRNGQPVSAQVKWSATGGAIDQSGLFTPDRTGTITVEAKTGIVSGRATVTVMPGALARIRVDPASAAITADDSQRFAAFGEDARGNPVALAPAWSASGGAIDGTGLFTPASVGAFKVTAADKGTSGSASVTVTAGKIVALEVLPSAATVRADASRRFEAIGTDAKGNQVSISVTWAVEGGSGAGAVDATGLYTPERTGTFTIKGSAAGISADATAVVVPGKLARAAIDPAKAALSVGDSLAFRVSGEDSKGNGVASLSAAWSVSGGVGEVDRAGTFTAARSGTGKVVARVSDGEASVSVEAQVVVKQAWSWLLWPFAISVAAIVGVAAAAARRRKRKREESARQGVHGGAFAQWQTGWPHKAGWRGEP